MMFAAFWMCFYLQTAQLLVAAQQENPVTPTVQAVNYYTMKIAQDEFSTYHPQCKTIGGGVCPPPIVRNCTPSVMETMNWVRNLPFSVHNRLCMTKIHQTICFPAGSVCHRSKGNMIRCAFKRIARKGYLIDVPGGEKVDERPPCPETDEYKKKSKIPERLRTRYNYCAAYLEDAHTRYERQPIIKRVCED